MTLEMLQQTHEYKRLPHDGIKREVLYTEEEISNRVKEIADKISEDYKGKAPVLIGILNGATFFLTDLMRNLDPDLSAEMDSIKISSYGMGQESSGKPEIGTDLKNDIEDRHVIIVEDIVDTGHSIHTVLPVIAEKKPASVKVCALMSKPDRREVDVPIDYLGFTIPDYWVEGGGLDSGEKNRGLRDIVIVHNTT
jgi:hypoxanthine phosphoribosyltransferase